MDARITTKVKNQSRTVVSVYVATTQGRVADLNCRAGKSATETGYINTEDARGGTITLRLPATDQRKDYSFNIPPPPSMGGTVILDILISEPAFQQKVTLTHHVYWETLAVRKTAPGGFRVGR